MKRTYRGFFTLVVGVILIAAVVAVFLNRRFIGDYFAGLTFSPSEEMRVIGDALDLTDRGKFLFKATRPSLNERDDFNAICRKDDDRSEVAVFGCYTNGKIYIYNIASNELEGVKQLTMAHELLHAVWERMTLNERKSLKSALETVLEMNTESLASELNNYDESEKMEELYVRAGTEVTNLPEILEKHYGEIFKNQDEVVGFYNQYIGVFREIEAEMTELEGQLEALGEEIDAKKDEYERRVTQYDADVVSFNSCAAVAGCFKSDDEFAVRRGRLLDEQVALNVLYEEINVLVDDYNGLVERYNADVTRNNELRQKMNSNVVRNGANL